MAQSGSVLAWGARGPGFESQYPDMKTATEHSVAVLFSLHGSSAMRLNRCYGIYGVMRRIKLLWM